MDLSETRIGKKCPPAVSAVRGSDIAPHGIGRKEKGVAVPSTGQDHGIGRMGLNFTGHHIAGDDPFGLTIDDDQIEHFVARIHFHRAGRNLMAQLRVNPEEQLLPGLAPRVEGP